MGEIILNEYAWSKDIIAKQSLGDKPYETIARLARFYYHCGYRKSMIGKMLEEFILRCDSSSNMSKWHEYIDKCVKNADKYPLINIQHIPITDAEIEKINELEYSNEKCVAFTLLCLAKYGNAVNPKNNNWVNKDWSEIFALANVKINTNRKAMLMNRLMRYGVIGFSKIVDNININVRFINDSSDPVMLVDDYRNLGYQYMNHIRAGAYINCQSCGVIIKKTGRNHRYCAECGAEIKRMQRLKLLPAI